MTKHTFVGTVRIFPQEGGWHYVPVPTELSRPLEHLADRGLIAVNATVGSSTWPTSLLPMGDDTHFLALPAKVRTKEQLTLDGPVEVHLETRARSSR